MKTELIKQKKASSTGIQEKDSLLGKRTKNQDSLVSLEDKNKQQKIDEKQTVLTIERKSLRNLPRVDYNEDRMLDKIISENSASGSGGISLMLAQKFEGDIDPTGWYMSEKLDGVRCYWNGKNMYSRNGNLFYPPDWFKDLLPVDLALDGELWTKRNDFQKAVSIVRRQDKNDEWKTVTYMVYDAPLLKQNFKKRLNIIQKALSGSDRSEDQKKHVKFHEQIVCKSVEHLDQEMDRVLKMDGEGLMLKDPESKYERRRSEKLLKVKKFDDSEAIVIGHQRGTGRCSEMLGALVVKSCVDGQTFKVGSGFDDSQRRKPPKIGSKITIKHQGVSKSGIPRFPIFLRMHPGM